MIRFAILVFFLASTSLVEAGPIEATYRVRVRLGNTSEMGSGTAISKHWLVTCCHVVENAGKNRVELYNAGQQTTGQVCARRPGPDLALVYCHEGFKEWTKIAENDPTPGMVVQGVGFGRGEGTLRAGKGVAQGIGGRRQDGTPVWHCSVIMESGDSGCGLFNMDGELVSVNWGAADDTPGGVIVGPSRSTPVSALHREIAIYETQCPGGWCPILPWRRGVEGRLPQQPRQSPANGPNGGQMVPVQPKPPTQAGPPVRPLPGPAPDPEPAPPIARGCNCDPNALIGITTRLSMLEGKVISFDKKLDELAVAGERLFSIEQQLTVITNKVNSLPAPVQVDYNKVQVMIDASIAKIKFPDPPAPIPMPDEPEADQVHFVVVADQTAGYWPRLASFVQAAQATYSFVRVAAPPPYPVGSLPQLVAYRGTTAIGVVKTRKSVEDRLSEISKGTYPAE